MRRRGRSTRSNRESDRSISRIPDYKPRQPGYKPPSSFRSLSGGPPAYNRDVPGRTKKTTDTSEESE